MTGNPTAPARNRRPSADRPRARGGMAGQALVLFVVLIGTLSLGLILLFNTGQVVDKKVRLTNAADAAAYSVAVQQARAMNYAAYMNRGRVANEVAVAQMVSLWSWLNMIHAHTVEGYNIFTYMSAIPYVGVIFQALARVYQVAERAVAIGRGLANPALNLTVQVLDELNGLFHRSTEVMLELGGTAGGILVAHNVVERNDPTAKITPLATALLAMQLRNATPGRNDSFMETHALPRTGQRTAGMDRFRNVVMASRDRFSADRVDEAGVPFIDLEAAGGTDMVDYTRWVGMDTLDLSIGIDFFGLDFTFDAPLGWGGAQAVKQQQNQNFFPGIRSGGGSRRGNGWYSEYHPGNRTYRQYNGVSQRSASGNLAGQYPSVDAPFYVPMGPSGNLNKRRDAYLTGYDGLRAYSDIRSGKAKRPDGEEAGPVFSVYVESDRADARSAEDIDGLGGRNGGKLELKSVMNDDKMTAIASAQVYFNRAPDNDLFRRMVPKSWNGTPRRDNQLEQGNLFSPYWQARLIDTPTEIYAAVGAMNLVGP